MPNATASSDRKTSPDLSPDILAYDATQAAGLREICELLSSEIGTKLRGVPNKIWHRAPVWFIDENPIVGYWARKGYVQLLFWSGQSFDEPGLSPEGKFKAAEMRITDVREVKLTHLRRWLTKARTIQWDYRNLVKRRGVLEKLGTW